MKKLVSLTLLAIILCASCTVNIDNTTISTDDSILVDTTKTDTANTKGITIAKLDKAIAIAGDGVTKKNGKLPQSTNNVDLELAPGTNTAYPKYGFNLQFATANEDFAGAYIIFKDTNGNTSNTYFDVPKSAIITYYSDSDSGSGSDSNERSKRTSLSFFKRHHKSQRSTYTEAYIDVNFLTQLPEGTFCYDICLYDNNNNISKPIEKCVTIKNWGGTIDFTGDWVFDRSVPDIFDDTVVELVNIDCNNGNSISVETVKPDSFKYFILFGFNANGDFNYNLDYESDNLDYDATAEACEAIYKNEFEKVTGDIAKWAYDKDTKALTIVAFKETYIYNEGQEVENYEFGDVFFENSTTKVINNELVITLNENYPDDKIELYFKKK